MNMLTPATSVLSLLLSLTLISCAPGLRLETTRAEDSALIGTYTLILHGCSYGNDTSTIAFLQPENQPYTFAPASPAFQFRVEEGVPAATALAKAQEFINCSAHYQRPQLRAILGLQGEVIGYELRPIYRLSGFGVPDVLNVSYYVEGQQVLIYVTPMNRENDGDDRDDGRGL